MVAMDSQALPYLPLFPLQAPLFPEGLLSLRIFEPRYLDLMRRCQQEQQPFGVVCLIEGGEVRRRGAGEAFVQERFHEVGTLAHLLEVQQVQSGLLWVRCAGGQRFQLERSECQPHGLWTGQGRLLTADAALPVPPDLAHLAPLLQSLLSKLVQAASDEELPIQPPYRWDDCGWLANRWCEMLPLSNEARQRLLAQDSPLLRLELVADQLEQLGIGEARRP